MKASHAFAAASALLQYPTSDTLALVPALQERRAHTDEAAALADFADWLSATPLLDAQAHYVELFDRRRRACLYLSYYLNGDTRRRGMALVAFKEAYQSKGWDPTDDELPDFLPTLLQFAAAVDEEAGTQLLAQHRSGLVVLERALSDAKSPYRGVVSAMLAHVPEGADDAAHAELLIAAGPPAEMVGLEPFAAAETVGV